MVNIEYQKAIIAFLANRYSIRLQYGGGDGINAVQLAAYRNSKKSGEAQFFDELVRGGVNCFNSGSARSGGFEPGTVVFIMDAGKIGEWYKAATAVKEKQVVMHREPRPYVLSEIHPSDRAYVARVIEKVEVVVRAHGTGASVGFFINGQDSVTETIEASKEDVDGSVFGFVAGSLSVNNRLGIGKDIQGIKTMEFTGGTQSHVRVFVADGVLKYPAITYTANSSITVFSDRVFFDRYISRGGTTVTSHLVFLSDFGTVNGLSFGQDGVEPAPDIFRSKQLLHARFYLRKDVEEVDKVAEWLAWLFARKIDVDLVLDTSSD